jgi:hypothetical protein
MIGLGISIGTGLGVALGLVFDNLALGIAIGASIGVAIGAALEQNRVGTAADAYGASRRALWVLVGVGLVLLLALVGLLTFFGSR